VQTWTSDPIPLPLDFKTASRIDLEFENIRRDDGSFTAFVFVNPERSLPDDAGRDEQSFAGSFSVFAPAECWGTEGHCDWERGPVSAFDRRPPHHLTPINVTVEITERVAELDNPGKLVIEIHAARPAARDSAAPPLRFDQVIALAYQR
jgi:hypothetical protein